MDNLVELCRYRIMTNDIGLQAGGNNLGYYTKYDI